MFKIRNYFSILIFISIALLVLYFNSFKAISTSLNSLVASSEQKELLEKFNDFKISKKLFLYVENLDNSALKKIQDIEKQLIQIPSLSIDSFQENSFLKEHNKEYFLYQNIKNIDYLEDININNELENLKLNLLNSQFSYFIDKTDPFHIFKKEEKIANFFIKNYHLAVKDMGYLSIFSINNEINSIDKYKKLYNQITNITNNHLDIKVFSSLFYFVENEKIVKDDVNNIVYLATFILILLYLIILRDLKLLFNALLTLGSSILFALLISSFIFNEINIFVLVFGISISTVAIDYMFHHYVHKEYEGNFRFNKDVFLGMLTTISAFFIISFVSFPLIKQLSIFTVLTLLFSYIQFAFIYQKIGFKYRDSKITDIKTVNKIPAKIVLVFIVLSFFISIYNFKFDSNLKNLDVNNEELNSLQEFFNKSIASNDKIPFLIKANSIDELIQNSKALKKEFTTSFIPLSALISKDEFYSSKKSLENKNIDNLNQKIDNLSKEFGFKDNFFIDSYKVSEKEPKYTFEALQDMGFEVLRFKNQFISYVNISKNELNLVNNYDFLINISIKSMFEDELNSIKEELILHGLIAIIFIVSIVLISYRKNLFIYLAFLFFPFSMILSLTLFIELNILHIFILFIILSISIDYGIYVSSYKKDTNTNKAIIYSILTTFAGFGVLIFSNLNALFSIGLASSVGILSILFLLIFLKRSKFESNSL